MSGTPRVASVHVSGTTLSHLLAAAYATAPATKYLFTLYGHYDTRSVVTDMSDNAEVFEVIVVGAVPVNTKFRGKADPVGILSMSKSPSHKLSFQDTSFLVGGGGINITKQGRETDPKVFILMTEDANGSRPAGTLKIEFTAYQISPGPGEPYRVIPMRTDNLVDSLPDFTTIGDTCRRNPSVMHLAKSDTVTTEERSSVLETAVHRIESDAKEKDALVKRIQELHKVIAAKKAEAAASKR